MFFHESAVSLQTHEKRVFLEGLGPLQSALAEESPLTFSCMLGLALFPEAFDYYTAYFRIIATALEVTA